MLVFFSKGYIMTGVIFHILLLVSAFSSRRMGWKKWILEKQVAMVLTGFRCFRI
jgi:hypothetical protein